MSINFKTTVFTNNKLIGFSAGTQQKHLKIFFCMALIGLKTIYSKQAYLT